MSRWTNGSRLQRCFYMWYGRFGVLSLSRRRELYRLRRELICHGRGRRLPPYHVGYIHHHRMHKLILITVQPITSMYRWSKYSNIVVHMYTIKNNVQQSSNISILATTSNYLQAKLNLKKEHICNFIVAVIWLNCYRLSKIYKTFSMDQLLLRYVYKTSRWHAIVFSNSPHNAISICIVIGVYI